MSTIFLLMLFFGNLNLANADSDKFTYLFEGLYGQTYHHQNLSQAYGFDFEVIFPDHHWSAAVFFDVEHNPLQPSEDKNFSGLMVGYLFDNHLKTIFGVGLASEVLSHHSYSLVRAGLGYEWHPYKDSEIMIVPTYLVDSYHNEYDHSFLMGIAMPLSYFTQK